MFNPRTTTTPHWLAAIALLAVACAGGCRGPGNRAYHEQLINEKRLLEDQLYDLAYDYEILEQKFQSQHLEHGHIGSPIEIDIPATAEELSNPDGTPRPVPDPEYMEVQPIAPSPNELPDPNTNPSGPPDLSPPGNGNDADLQPGAPPVEPGPPPTVDPPPIIPNGQTQATRAGVGHVAEIRLNPVHTGGEDFDNLPGDDGIAVLIEPRGSRGELLPQPAKVSIVVVDPAAPNDQARVARWDLSEQETSEHLQRTGDSKGIQLKLPWPQARPQHSKLRLFVRYETSDGRKLESDREFYITMNGAIANRWTARSRQRSVARRDKESEPARSPAPMAPPSSDRSGMVSPSTSSTEASQGEPNAPIRQVVRPTWRPTR